MSRIRVIVIANTKSMGRVGDEREVSAEELRKYPHIFRAKVDVEAEQRAAAAQVPMSSEDRHRAMKAQLREERARLEEQQALLAADRAKQEQLRAEEVAARARKSIEEAALLAKQQEVEADNARLRQLLAAREAADKAVAEMAPPAAEAPAGEPAAAPHQRKRGG